MVVGIPPLSSPGGPHEPEVVDPRRRRRRRLHASRRHHDRERRAAGHLARARRLARRPAVGARRLRALPGRAAAHRRIAGRPLRAPVAVRDRHRRVHRGLAAVRAGERSDLPRPRAGRPGRRRRADVRDRAGPALRLLQRARPRHRLRRVRRRHGRRRRRRPGARRRAHQRHLLALDLLRQHPGRRRGAGDHARARGGVARPAPAAARLGRLRDLLARPRGPRLRPHPLPRRRLGRGQRGRLAERRRRAAGRLRRGRARPARADVRPRPAAQARRSWAV